MSATTPTRPHALTGAACPDTGAYFACLASYNEGTLHGAWVDLAEISDAAELQECIDYILATSPTPGAEEWAMHDSSGLPAVLARSEWPGLGDLAAYGAALQELGDDNAEPFRLYCDNLGEIASPDAFREAFAGEWDSEEAFAEELAAEIGAIPQELSWPLYCISWERAWCELRIGGDYYSEVSSDSGALYVFRGC
jgi:antirestriction protein